MLRLCVDFSWPIWITNFITIFAENCHRSCSLQTWPWLDPCQWTPTGKHRAENSPIQTSGTYLVVRKGEFAFLNKSQTIFNCFQWWITFLSRNWKTMKLTFLRFSDSILLDISRFGVNDERKIDLLVCDFAGKIRGSWHPCTRERWWSCVPNLCHPSSYLEGIGILLPKMWVFEIDVAICEQRTRTFLPELEQLYFGMFQRLLERRWKWAPFYQPFIT